jgi:hypothetical protein
VLCRWISEDPIGEAGGINLYQFCGNNPINRIDVFGCNPVSDAMDYLVDSLAEPLNNMASNLRYMIDSARINLFGEPVPDPNAQVCITQGPPETFSREDIRASILFLAGTRLGPPSRGTGYKPPKNWNGELVKNPNGPGSGYPSKGGKVWVPTDHKGTHAPHYDVQDPKTGGHTPVYMP